MPFVIRSKCLEWKLTQCKKCQRWRRYFRVTGREALAQGCEEHLRHDRQNWRPFARAVFVPLRSVLLRLVEMLPLQGAPTTEGLLRLVGHFQVNYRHSLTL